MIDIRQGPSLSSRVVRVVVATFPDMSTLLSQKPLPCHAKNTVNCAVQSVRGFLNHAGVGIDSKLIISVPKKLWKMIMREILQHLLCYVGKD